MQNLETDSCIYYGTERITPVKKLPQSFYARQRYTKRYFQAHIQTSLNVSSLITSSPKKCSPNATKLERTNSQGIMKSHLHQGSRLHHQNLETHQLHLGIPPRRLGIHQENQIRSPFVFPLPRVVVFLFPNNTMGKLSAWTYQNAN